MKKYITSYPTAVIVVCALIVNATESIFAQSVSIEGGSQGMYTETITVTDPTAGTNQVTKVEVKFAGFFGKNNSIDRCNDLSVSYQTLLNGLPARVQYTVTPSTVGEYLHYDATVGLQVTKDTKVKGTIVFGNDTNKITKFTRLLVAKSGVLEESWLVATDSTLPQTEAQKVKDILSQSTGVSGSEPIPRWLFRINKTFILKCE